MRTSDLAALGCVAGVFAAFVFLPGFLDGFIYFTKNYPYASSFVKFAILATFGECLGLRIAKGSYNRPGFGVLPRAFVWGCFGIFIKCSLVIFVAGTPDCMADLGLPVSAATLATGSFMERLLMAFGISFFMNIIFSPVLMTMHKVTDAHIANTGGTLAGFFSNRMDVAKLIAGIDWNMQWGFVFKKTLPFFWIPAHIITFLLPSYFQILYAAALGIALGVLMAVSSLKAKKASA